MEHVNVCPSVMRNWWTSKGQGGSGTTLLQAGWVELADASFGAYDEGQGEGVPVLVCVGGFARGWF